MARNPTEQEVRDAYREVLGRSPDRGGMETYLKSGLSGDKLKKDLASSAEAGRRKELDPTKYGVKVHSIDKLEGRDKETFEKYKSKFGWSNLTPMAMQELRSVKYAFKTDEAEKQFNRGNIRWEYGGFMVRPEAVKALGSDLNKHLAGGEGTKWYYPKTTTIDGQEVDVKMENKRFAKAQEFNYGGTAYMGTQRVPKPGSGLLGGINEFLVKDIGMSEDLASGVMLAAGYTYGGLIGASYTAPKAIDEWTGIEAGYFLTDPLNVTSGMLYGAEGYKKNISEGASIFSTDVEDFAKYQGYGNVAASAAASVFLSPWVGAAMSSATTTSRAAVYSNSKGLQDAGLQSALNFAAAGVAEHAKNLAGAAYINAGTQATSSYVGSRHIYDLSESESLENAAWAAGGSLAGSALGNVAHGFAPATRLGQGLAAGGATLAGQTGVQALRGGDFDAAFWRGAATSSLLSAYQGQERGMEMEQKLAEFTEADLAWQERTFSAIQNELDYRAFSPGTSLLDSRMTNRAPFQATPPPVYRDTRPAWNQGFNFRNPNSIIKTGESLIKDASQSTSGLAQVWSTVGRSVVEAVSKGNPINLIQSSDTNNSRYVSDGSFVGPPTPVTDNTPPPVNTNPVEGVPETLLNKPAEVSGLDRGFEEAILNRRRVQYDPKAGQSTVERFTSGLGELLVPSAQAGQGGSSADLGDIHTYQIGEFPDKKALYGGYPIEQIEKFYETTLPQSQRDLVQMGRDRYGVYPSVLIYMRNYGVVPEYTTTSQKIQIAAEKAEQRARLLYDQAAGRVAEAWDIFTDLPSLAYDSASSSLRSLKNAISNQGRAGGMRLRSMDPEGGSSDVGVVSTSVVGGRQFNGRKDISDAEWRRIQSGLDYTIESVDPDREYFRANGR